MNERLTKVLDYEKRLIQDRQQLQDLIAESNESDPQLIKDKLEYFAVELTHMHRQMQILKSDVTQKEQMASPVVPAAQVETPQAQQTLQPTTDSTQTSVQVQPTMAQIHSHTSQPVTQGTTGSVPPEYIQKTLRREMQAQDLEKTIGKSLMGIFASVLIFISLILFATLLLPYFNDTAKMITTYVVSFAFTGLGLYKLKKDKENKFYIALTGCGVGAVYISLLLSNIYFKAIGDITLYVLIALWGVGVCFLSKLQNKLFEVIGHLGIMISVIFGCILCLIYSDVTKFTVLMLFYLVSSMVFYVVHCKKELRENIIFHCFNLINCFLLGFSGIFILAECFSLSTIIMPIILAIYIGILLRNKAEQSWSAFGIFMTIYAFTLFNCLTIISSSVHALGLIYYLAAVILLLLIEWKPLENCWDKYIPQAFLIWMAAAGIESIRVLDCYGLIFLVMLPLLALGFLRKNEVCRYSVLIGLFYVCYKYYGQTPYFLCGIVAIVAIFFCIYKFKEQYSIVYKYCAHALTILFMLYNISNILYDVLALLYIVEKRYFIVSAITYVLLAAYNIGMLKTCFGKNLQTGEEEGHSLYYIINMCLMIYGLFLIGDGGTGFWHLLAILTTLVVFMVNVKNLLDKRDNILCGIYVGVKFATLIYVILGSFDAVNYVVSIVFFIFAIACIMLGFKFNYKSLRVFGLVLSMISTFKLVMIDITYDNTLGHALSFFVSGILCFAISLIYNFIDKKISHDTESDRHATE